MVINSDYDSWVIPSILNIHCLRNGKSGVTLSNCNTSQMQYIESYRSHYKEVLNKGVLNKFMAVNQELSIWSIVCSSHVYASL